MTRPVYCPYLGLREDPDTHLEFPADANVCHKARPLQAVAMDHQRGYCLTGSHAACPVYQRAALAPLPAGIAARPEPAGPLLTRGRLLRAGGLALVLLAFLALLAGLGMGSAAELSGGSGSGSSMPVTGGGRSALSADLSGADARLFDFSTPTRPARTRRACPPPAGWISYVVKPTDSLIALSQLYSVPVEALQQANCLGENRVIFPGELVYLPPQPTLAPLVAVRTPTRMPLYNWIPPTVEPTDPPDQPEPAQPSPRPTNTLMPQPTATLPASTATQPPPTLAPTATLTLPAPTKPGNRPTRPPDPTEAPTATEQVVPTSPPQFTDTPEPTPDPTEELERPPKPTKKPRVDSILSSFLETFFSVD